jgi:acyl transferase domain-containing protein
MDPIAVIGLHAKFSGDATDPNAFFEMLKRGQSGLSEIPQDRFNIDAFYHPQAERRGMVSEILSCLGRDPV